MDYMSYQSNAAEVPVMRKWLLRMFVISLLLHLALIAFFRTKKLDRFHPLTERLVPRAFSVQRLDVDPKLLESDEAEPPKQLPQKMPDVKPVDLPDEKPSVEKLDDNTRVTPVAPELTKPIAMDKPRVEAANLQALANSQNSAAKEMDNDLKALTKNLIQDKPKASSLLKYNADSTITSGNADAAGMAAASGRLDELLGRGLQKGDAPVSLPGGALFEFGSADLRQEAKIALGKLGQLIKKSPRVIFRIEGYADSFGSTAFNEQLSQQRADAVKRWLVENMEVDPSRIETIGYGSTGFKVAPQQYAPKHQASIDAEIARQQPNRRVEIVFRFPQGG